MNLKKISIAFLICLATILTPSCRHCIEGNSNIIVEDRTSRLDGFTEVISNSNCNLYIGQGADYNVKVEGDDNIIPYIKVFTNNSRLTIETSSNKCFNSSYPINVYIKMNELTRLTLNGSGDIECDSMFVGDCRVFLFGSGNIDFRYIDAREIDAEIAGSGNINLIGNSNYTNLSIEGSGDIRAYKLYSGEVKASIEGSGNIYCFFYDLLTADIYGSGNIFFKGDSRRVQYRIDGSGKLIDGN